LDSLQVPCLQSASSLPGEELQVDQDSHRSRAVDRDSVSEQCTQEALSKVGCCCVKLLSGRCIEFGVHSEQACIEPYTTNLIPNHVHAELLGALHPLLCSL
jgi:hypothetical protein